MSLEIFAYLPHGCLSVSEKEQVDFPGHVRWPLHVHVVIEEMLDSGNLAQTHQLIPVTQLLFVALVSLASFAVTFDHGKGFSAVVGIT